MSEQKDSRRLLYFAAKPGQGKPSTWEPFPTKGPHTGAVIPVAGAPCDLHDCLINILREAAEEYKGKHRGLEFTVLVEDDITWDTFKEDTDLVAETLHQKKICASIVDHKILETETKDFKIFDAEMKDISHLRHIIVWDELPDKDVTQKESELSPIIKRSSQYNVANNRFMLKVFVHFTFEAIEIDTRLNSLRSTTSAMLDHNGM